TRRGLERPLAVLLHDLAVELDPAPVPQVLDHVPVGRALVRSTDHWNAGADRQVNRPVYLLVEERVPHLALDGGVAADPELAEHSGALVDVERSHQRLLIRRRGRLDDAPVLVSHSHPFDDLRLLPRRVLRETDDPFRPVLQRAVEPLAAGHVHVPVVDLSLAAGDAEAQVGLVADDPHLLGGIETILDPPHLFALGVPVEQHRAEEEVLELAQAHSGLLGERRSWVAARDPWDLEREPARDERTSRVHDRVVVFHREVGPLARVLRRADADPRVALVLELDAERRALRHELRWRSFCPDRLERPKVHSAEAELNDRDRFPPPHRADALLDGRPRLCAADHQHLPAGLDVDAALDEKARVLLDAWISHSSPLLYSDLDFVQLKT